MTELQEQRVCHLARLGVRVPVIAQRLNLSPESVRHCLHRHDIPLPQPKFRRSLKRDLVRDAERRERQRAERERGR